MPMIQRYFNNSRRAAIIPVTFAILATICVIIVAGGLIAWKIISHKAPPAAEIPPVDVSVLTIQSTPELADSLILPAVVEPFESVTVSAEVAGRVEEACAKEGCRVAAGDVILRLNKDLLKAACDSTEAQAKYDTSEYKRLSELLRGGAATGRDVDAARAKMEISQAIFNEVKARLDRAIIHAPISGVLDDVPVDAGEYVNAGEVVARIVQLDKVKVVVDAPEKDVQYFSIGAAADVIAYNKNGEHELRGAISYISEVADAGTRTSRMEITVPNETRLLRGGEIVRARLVRSVLKDAIFVPLLAVLPLEDGKFVFTVKDGKAEPQRVELGIFKDSNVQITQGLKPGDQLIVKGQRLIGPGQAVRVVPGGESAQ